MSAFRSALFEWSPSRVRRVVISAFAVWLSLRVTDGFVLGLGPTLVLVTVLDAPWWASGRWVGRSVDGSTIEPGSVSLADTKTSYSISKRNSAP